MASREQIIDALKEVYNNIDTCLLHSSNDAHVVDEPNFSVDKTIPGFDVKNPNNKSFSLLQIDNHLLNSDIYQVGQCDGAIVSDDEISLLEFKTNATTDKLDKNCGKAESQIYITAMRMNWALSRLNKCFLSMAKIKGYICFNSYPQGGANYQTRQVRFLERTGIELFYSNEKTL